MSATGRKPPQQTIFLQPPPSVSLGESPPGGALFLIVGIVVVCDAEANAAKIARRMCLLCLLKLPVAGTGQRTDTVAGVSLS